VIERGMLRLPVLLEWARGQSCVNCGADDSTIVAAHSNLQEHGRGHANPAHDCFHAHLCYRCHAWVDAGGVASNDPSGRYAGTRDGKAEMMRRAIDATALRLWRAGALRVVKRGR
jgi:cytochrome c551/c552